MKFPRKNPAGHWPLLSACIAALLVLVTGCSAPEEKTVEIKDNPDCGCSGIQAKGAAFAHDPTIIRDGDTWWRFTTGPGIQLSWSADMKEWSKPVRVFAENPAWTSREVPGSTDFWAPEVVRRQGMWRMYYSVSTFGSNVSAIGMATIPSLDKAHPEKPWDDRGLILRSGPAEDYNAIDPAVFPDGKGKDWMVWGSFWGGIRIHPLDASGKLEGGITRPEGARTIASRMTPPNAIEGAFVLPKGEWFYLFVSHDFCCKGVASDYHIVVGRSRAPEGPYEDRDGRPMDMGGGTLLRDGTDDPDWAGPGHCSVTVAPDGTAWLVYHAYSRAWNGVPVLQMDPLTWDSDGWPSVPSQSDKAARAAKE